MALQSSGVRGALQPQDGLYTLAVLGQTPSHRVIGARRELLAAPQNPAAVFERLTRPAVQIVTNTTVTKKGYCLLPDGTLDLALARQDAVRQAIIAAYAALLRGGVPPAVTTAHTRA